MRCWSAGVSDDERIHVKVRRVEPPPQRPRAGMPRGLRWRLRGGVLAAAVLAAVGLVVALVVGAFLAVLAFAGMLIGAAMKWLFGGAGSGRRSDMTRRP